MFCADSKCDFDCYLFLFRAQETVEDVVSVDTIGLVYLLGDWAFKMILSAKF